MNYTGKNIKHNLIRGLMIICISASTALMSCDSNGGADGMGSGANNDTELEENSSGNDSGMDTKKENPNGVGTKDDMQMNTDTTSNIDQGGTSSKGSGSGVDDRMGTERSGTNTDMNTGDMKTGADSTYGKSNKQ